MQRLCEEHDDANDEDEHDEEDKVSQTEDDEEDKVQGRHDLELVLRGS